MVSHTVVHRQAALNEVQRLLLPHGVGDVNGWFTPPFRGPRYPRHAYGSLVSDGLAPRGARSSTSWRDPRRRVGGPLGSSGWTGARAPFHSSAAISTK